MSIDHQSKPPKTSYQLMDSDVRFLLQNSVSLVRLSVICMPGQIKLNLQSGLMYISCISSGGLMEIVRVEESEGKFTDCMILYKQVFSSNITETFLGFS